MRVPGNLLLVLMAALALLSLVVPITVIRNATRR
jgi:hypothetical protein